MSPVRPILFQEASFGLSQKRLRVLSSEVEIFQSWWWNNELFDEILVTPEADIDV